MGKTERILLLTALILLGAGWSLYHLGSQLNLEVGDYDQMLWDQAPGDKWLYVGGLMMLISGSLAADDLSAQAAEEKKRHFLQLGTLSSWPYVNHIAAFLVVYF